MKTRSIDYRVLGPGYYSLIVDGRSHEVFVREKKNGFEVEINGHLIPVQAENEPSGVAKKSSKQEEVVNSPMPGRVIAIKVKEGDLVKEGEGLLVVEAMKMENEITAPKSGKVKEVRVKEGETVEGGQELVRIE